jgi:hypothetical protein
MDHSHDPDASAPANLSDYTPTGDWLDQFAGPFFDTRAAFDWFVKRNRRELIERGALIPRAGRAGSLVSISRMSTAVVDILRRRALERAA